jgi:hypothetical protein
LATRHGSKVYLQLLLDPNRAKLLQDLAGEQNKRTTAVMRDILYSYLERTLPSSVYGEAAAKDHAVWRESVSNRVKGRSKKKKEDEG